MNTPVGLASIAESFRLHRRDSRFRTIISNVMADLRDGEYLITNVQWNRRDRDETLRPLHGFTTGHLSVDGGTARISARFNDLFLSNRMSDMEEDGTPITLLVSVLESDEVYRVPCSAPTLDRSGASYMLHAQGSTGDLSVQEPA